jgi:hypothetical protein
LGLADTDDAAAATARLETALDRIASRLDALNQAHAARPDPNAPDAQAQARLVQDVASRLDATIARLRMALGEQSGRTG